MSHLPVLLNEVLVGLNLKVGETVLDATINRGGHALAMGRMIGPTGHLIGLDADSIALAEAKTNLGSLECKKNFLLGNFRNLSSLLNSIGVTQINVALFDLGLSSEQLAESDRGFSFQHDGLLRMTLVRNVSDDTLTAEEIVNTWDEENLITIIKNYGEETFANSIARAIVDARRSGGIKTTFDLVKVIQSAVPHWYQKRRLHFATKTFQAIRMTVNDELRALREGLEGAWRVLAPHGRLAIISFHSLEAKQVKIFFKEQEAEGAGRQTPRHATKPTRAEVLNNPRSRSANLRFLIKS